jgi:hypothetical protein
MLWAALTGVGAVVSMFGMGSCSDVESCARGAEGCIGGAPDVSGNCQAGLVRNAAGTQCVEPGDEGMAPVDPCGCGANELCRADKQCVNVCVNPTNLPARKPVPPPCRLPAGETPYTFAEASVALCYQVGIHRAELCPGSSFNPMTECTADAATRAAGLLCPLQNPDCAIALCEAARDRPCAMQQCPPGVQPSCEGVVCSQSCATASFLNDGVCDDGDLSNAQSGVCAWGSDCGDCGPRRGTAPVFERDIGDPCTDPRQCGGNSSNIASSKGWCVPTDTSIDLYRCVTDCSQAGETCPSGYECIQLGQDLDGEGVPNDPVMDSFGSVAAACFPRQCG